MSMRTNLAALAMGFGGLGIWGSRAGAAEVTGQPVPWQMGMQQPASPVMEQIYGFHDILLVVTTVISVFVLGLLIYVIVRFNAKSNPQPSKNTHNTLIEVLWTVVPIVILVLIAVPSFKLLYYQGVVPEADMTIKARGTSYWTWEYEYPDEGIALYPAMLDAEAAAASGQPYLLASDVDLVVPIKTVVRVQVIADGILHAWAVPALGVKIDAVPGRLNETWLYVDEPGIYYGQCSELCGTNHSFMPISVRAVTGEEYQEWLTFAREEYARSDAPVDMAGVAPVAAR